MTEAEDRAKNKKLKEMRRVHLLETQIRGLQRDIKRIESKDSHSLSEHNQNLLNSFYQAIQGLEKQIQEKKVC